MQGAAISRGLLHLFEHGDRTNFVIRLPRLQQAHRERVQVFNRWLRMHDPHEWLDSLCVVAVLCERACEYTICSEVVRVCSLDLLRLLDRILELAGLNFSRGQVETRARKIFKMERIAVEFNCLGIRRFRQSQLRQLAKSDGDETLIGELRCSRVP